MPKSSQAVSAGDAAPEAFGLVWSSDSEPGIRRVRRGSSFAYLDARGRAVRDEATLARIRRLAVPPAYEDVWICPRADGHLQATGRDARGRKQYRYHAQWQAGRGSTKFERLREFGLALPRIRRRVEAHLAGSDQPTRERVMATLVRLLDTTWLRVGNAQYVRENGSYGLSTLRNRHAGIEGTRLRLSFVGKSGVRHDALVTDRRVARVVRRCRELPGQELFQYLDEAGEVRRVGSADINAWLADAAGRPVTAKDFRTWHGSVLALELARGASAAEGRVANARSVIAAVAKRLGNTPAVCRKAYIHPSVLGLCESLADAAAGSGQAPRSDAPPRRRGLSLPERRLLGLLDARPRRRAPPATR